MKLTNTTSLRETSAREMQRRMWKMTYHGPEKRRIFVYPSRPSFTFSGTVLLQGGTGDAATSDGGTYR